MSGLGGWLDWVVGRWVGVGGLGGWVGGDSVFSASQCGTCSSSVSGNLAKCRHTLSKSVSMLYSFLE